MKSFVFWLATAASIGALVGSIMRPGLPEIVIVWAVALGGYYGWLNCAMKNRAASPGA